MYYYYKVALYGENGKWKRAVGEITPVEMPLSKALAPFASSNGTSLEHASFNSNSSPFMPACMRSGFLRGM